MHESYTNGIDNGVREGCGQGIGGSIKGFGRLLRDLLYNTCDSLFRETGAHSSLYKMPPVNLVKAIVTV